MITFDIEAASVHYEPAEDVKAKKQEENVKNVYPALLDKLDEIIKKNNGHIAAGKVTNQHRKHFTL